MITKMMDNEFLVCIRRHDFILERHTFKEVKKKSDTGYTISFLLSKIIYRIRYYNLQFRSSHSTLNEH